jgi:hypothetical protein
MAIGITSSSQELYSDEAFISARILTVYLKIGERSPDNEDILI